MVECALKFYSLMNTEKEKYQFKKCAQSIKITDSMGKKL